MKELKIVIRWLAGILILIIAFNTAGFFIAKKTITEPLLQKQAGYSVYGHDLLYPENNEAGRSAMIMRDILSDSRYVSDDGELNDLIFQNHTTDVSCIITDKNGISDLSAGSFVCVFSDEGKDKKSAGLINFTEFCKTKCSYELFQILKRQKHAVVKLDSFARKGMLIKPVSITVTDPFGDIVARLENPWNEEDGELVSETGYIMYNREQDSPENGLGEKIATEYCRRLMSEKAAEKMLSSTDPESADSVKDTFSYGYGKITGIHTEITDGYRVISVVCTKYLRGVNLYIMLTGSIYTLIFIIIAFSRSVKNRG